MLQSVQCLLGKYVYLSWITRSQVRWLALVIPVVGGKEKDLGAPWPSLAYLVPQANLFMSQNTS